MILKYQCQNAECPKYEEPVQIKPGQSAECESCSWFMEAIW